jgi:RNA polymerase sigma-70 factor (ECF subfamily)
VLAGDTAAFESLVRRYRRPALACAESILGDSAEADDVVQDAMLQSYEKLALLRAPEHFGGWLMTIVRRRAMNVLRSPHHRRRAILDTAAQVEARQRPDHYLVAARTREAVWRALDALPEREREVLLLSDLDGLSHADIAAILGISVFMSRRYLSKARRRARAVLQSMHIEV